MSMKRFRLQGFSWPLGRMQTAHKFISSPVVRGNSALSLRGRLLKYYKYEYNMLVMLCNDSTTCNYSVQPDISH